MMEFQPIRTARLVERGTRAELKLHKGEIVTATWDVKDGIEAWWMDDGGPAIWPEEPHSWRPLSGVMPSAKILQWKGARVERLGDDDDDGDAA